MEAVPEIPRGLRSWLKVGLVWRRVGEDVDGSATRVEESAGCTHWSEVGESDARLSGREGLAALAFR